MSETTSYLGARIDKDIMSMIEDTAKEEHVDKTKALKDLVILGRRQFLLQKYLEEYKKGRISLDKAAKSVGMGISEMMDEVVKEGIKSDETAEEYKEGLKLLMD